MSDDRRHEGGQESPDDPALVERATANFRAVIEGEAHPEGFAEACLRHPPWVVYEFGQPPRRGLIREVYITPDGTFAVLIAVLHRHNPHPPLFYERLVFGFPLASLSPVGIDRDVLARWAE